MQFSDIEAEFKRLKQQFEVGELSEESLKSRLYDLMIQDEQGRWWMIGYETGSWYCYQDEQWTPIEPPGAIPVPSAEVQPVEVAAAEGAAQDWRTQRKSSFPLPGNIEAWLSLILIGCVWGLNFLSTNMLGLFTEFAINWFLAGLATGCALRWVEPSIRWRQVAWITIVWTICGFLWSLLNIQL